MTLTKLYPICKDRTSGGVRKIIKPGQKFKDSKFTLYIICTNCIVTLLVLIITKLKDKGSI